MPPFNTVLKIVAFCPTSTLRLVGKTEFTNVVKGAGEAVKVVVGVVEGVFVEVKVAVGVFVGVFVGVSVGVKVAV